MVKITGFGSNIYPKDLGACPWMPIPKVRVKILRESL